MLFHFTKNGGCIDIFFILILRTNLKEDAYAIRQLEDIKIKMR